MFGWRLLSSLLLWGIILAFVTLRYTNGVFLLIAVVGLAALGSGAAGPSAW
jgi:hypothetical protein